MDAGVVTAAIGVVGTLVGVGITQWRSDVRDQRRDKVEEQRDQARLDREADRDRDARLFAHRQAAYASVIEQYHRWANIGADVIDGLIPSPPDDAMVDFWRLITEVRLLGGPDVARTAQAMYLKVADLVWLTPLNGKDPTDPPLEAQDALDDFLEAARVDLGVPGVLPREPDLIITTTDNPSE